MIVEVKNASITRDSVYLLKDVNWKINKGEHWAVLGLNGSGKTTLLNMLNGYIFPSQGDVSVLGKTLGNYDMRQLRKSIGWVSSTIQDRLHGYETALDIVLSGKFASIGLYDEPNDEDTKLANSLLEKLSCMPFAKRHYQTLSQGEKQRILIARGLMPQPDLLILDEPCTGLDIFARENLLEIIDTLSKDIDFPTLIYVTHHIEEILPNFSHSLLLRRGQVYSQGKTDDMLTSDNLSSFFEAPIICEKFKDRYLLSHL